MKCDLSLSSENRRADSEAIASDCAEILQHIRLSRKYRDLKLPPAINLDHPLWDYIDSIKRSSESDQGLQLFLSCPSNEDLTYLSIMFNTGAMRKLLQETLLNEEMKEKHSLSDTNLGVNISEEEMTRIVPEIQKSMQEESVEVSDDDDTERSSVNVGHEPTCSTWTAVKRYLESNGITGR